MYYDRRHEPANRAISYAVLASIVLHGALLFLVPGLRQPSKRADVTPGPIVARLAQPRVAAAPQPAPAQPEPPAPKVETPPPPPVAKPAPAVPTLKPAPAAKAERPQPKATPTPPAPAAPAPSAEPAPAAPPAASASPPAAIAKTEPQPQASPSAPSAEDAGSLAQYRLQLITVAKRYKRYPRVAMDNNWEGTAEIRMVIGANGMISSLVVRKGSGHEILDQEALQWIRKAKPLAPIPAALRGREFIVDIPVIFNLKEPEAG